MMLSWKGTSGLWTELKDLPVTAGPAPVHMTHNGGDVNSAKSVNEDLAIQVAPGCVALVTAVYTSNETFTTARGEIRVWVRITNT